MARLYSDTHIERWAKVYHANPAIRDYLVRMRLADTAFAVFLANPEAVIEAAIFARAMPLPDSEEYYGLLPAQEAVQRRLDRAASLDEAWEQQEWLLEREHVISANRNGALVEALHHRRFVEHRRHNTLFLPREVAP